MPPRPPVATATLPEPDLPLVPVAVRSAWPLATAAFALVIGACLGLGLGVVVTIVQ